VSLKLKLSNKDRVNFSPSPRWSFEGRNLDLIQGKVSISGKPNSLDISLFDNDALVNRTLGVQASALSLPDGNIISNKAHVSSITVWEATAANSKSQVNVAPTSKDLDNIGGQLTIHGNGSTALAVNDQADPMPSIRYTMTSGELKTEWFGPHGKWSLGWN